MKAVCWYGANDVRVETVPDPKIINPRELLLKSRQQQFAVLIYTFITATSPQWKRAISWVMK